MHSPALVCIKYRYSGVPPPDLSASQNQQEAFAVLNNNTTSISTETRRRSQDDSFFICSSFLLLLLLLLLFLLLSLFVAVVLSFPFCCYFILVFPSLLYNRGIILFYILLPSFFSIYLTLIVLGLSSAFIFLEIWSFLAIPSIRIFDYITLPLT